MEAESTAQRAQLQAESAALQEQRDALNRDRQSTQALSSLSAQVEAVSSTAVQREKRLTSLLENELMDREQRSECLFQISWATKERMAEVKLVSVQVPTKGSIVIAA